MWRGGLSGSRGANLFIGARNVSLIVLARTVRSGLETGSMLRKSKEMSALGTSPQDRF